MTSLDTRECPRCGAQVIYGGVGRRPVWCSTRCRNAAAVTRRGAREAAVEIRMIDVPRQPRQIGREPTTPARARLEAEPRDGVQRTVGIQAVRSRPLQVEPTWQEAPSPGPLDRKALTAAVLSDPAAVAIIILALDRLQQAGKFSGEKWSTIRSGVVILADRIRADEELSGA